MPAPRPLRIGVTCYPTHGGSGVVATELALEMARAGHEVHVISYEAPARLPGYHPGLVYHEVEVPLYPLFRYPPYSLALAAKMADVTADRGLDLLHVHYAIPHTISAHLAREMLPPDRRPAIVTTLHGTDITLVGAEPEFQRVTRLALAVSDAVTAVSGWLRDETVRLFGPCPAPQVIPNFVDTARFRPAPPGPPAAEARLVHISNFRPVKRVADVVHAFARVRAARPAHLQMVGEGPERPHAEALVRALGLRDAVTFLGRQDDVEAVLPGADVFLLPSDSESFGLSALEAMACGVPAVVTTVGGAAEVVRDGVDGALCPPGDPARLAETILAILADPARHAAMRVAARTRAEAFTPAQVVPLYEACYRAAVARAAATSAASRP